MTPADYLPQLKRAVPPAHWRRLTEVGALAAEHGWPAYLVGGLVRDLLLGLTPDDFDVALEGDAPALARALQARLGGQLVTHPPFGTATWTAPDGVAIDLATARTETYSRPAALPIVQTPAPLSADLARRDFTLNALAVRLDGPTAGRLLDLHGGLADLRARQIRVLHPGSFEHDPTRLFRAVRYEQRLAGQIAPETLALMPAARPALNALSGDRLRHELELVFREPRAAAMLARLDALGLLAAAHPAFAWGGTQTAAAAILEAPAGPAPDLADAPAWDAAWLALLLGMAASEAANGALTRLNVDRATGQAAREALALRRTWDRPSQAVAALDALSPAGRAAAYVARPELRGDLREYLATWRHVRSDHTGHDLLRRGLTPGPRFRDWLWRLRAARLDGQVTDRAGEAALLEGWVRDD